MGTEQPTETLMHIGFNIEVIPDLEAHLPYAYTCQCGAVQMIRAVRQRFRCDCCGRNLFVAPQGIIPD
jgi:hypothetical protein